MKQTFGGINFVTMFHSSTFLSVNKSGLNAMIYQGLERTIKNVVITLCIGIGFGETAVKDMCAGLVCTDVFTAFNREWIRVKPL